MEKRVERVWLDLIEYRLIVDVPTHIVAQLTVPFSHSVSHTAFATQQVCILKQKLYNFATNVLKSYLSIQPFSFSGFMISKTYIVAQKPC